MKPILKIVKFCCEQYAQAVVRSYKLSLGETYLTMENMGDGMVQYVLYPKGRTAFLAESNNPSTTWKPKCPFCGKEKYNE